MTEPFWRTKRLADMTPAEWESLCDGCGRCCTERFEVPGNQIAETRIACHLLNCKTARCSDYKNRLRRNARCHDITPEVVAEGWLPHTCAYRLVHEGKDLPEWHHLRGAPRSAVHAAGVGVAGRVHRPRPGERPLDQVYRVVPA